MAKLQQLKALRRDRRKKRIRRKIVGTTERPRVSIYSSNKHFVAQIIDDSAGVTVASASTHESDIKKDLGHNVAGATKLGEILATRAKEKKVDTVIFDRNGYLFHGRVKAFADALRENGIKL